MPKVTEENVKNVKTYLLVNHNLETIQRAWNVLEIQNIKT